jgi:hypothetical protein
MAEKFENNQVLPRGSSEHLINSHKAVKRTNS